MSNSSYDRAMEAGVLSQLAEMIKTSREEASKSNLTLQNVTRERDAAIRGRDLAISERDDAIRARDRELSKTREEISGLQSQMKTLATATAFAVSRSVFDEQTRNYEKALAELNAVAKSNLRLQDENTKLSAEVESLSLKVTEMNSTIAASIEASDAANVAKVEAENALGLLSGTTASQIDELERKITVISAENVSLKQKISRLPTEVFEALRDGNCRIIVEKKVSDEVSAENLRLKAENKRLSDEIELKSQEAAAYARKWGNIQSIIRASK